MSVFDYTGASMVWDFREHADKDDSPDSEAIIEFLQKNCKKWHFQKEEGGETGYIHWQGRLSWRKKLRGAEVAKTFDSFGMKLWAYIRPASKESCMGENFYAMKEETRIEGPWTNKDNAPAWIRPEFRNATLKPWQQEIAKTGESQDNRALDVLVCDDGNVGKSFMCHYLRQHKKAIMVPPIFDAERLIASVMNILMSTENRNPKLVFVDLSRSLPKDKMGPLWSACETIKDGFSYDLRYSYKEWDFIPPRVWIMTNAWPDRTALSRDRWRFWRLDETQTLVRAEPPKQGKKRKLPDADDDSSEI